MARYKKIYRDEQHELDKKRDRIRKTIDVCVALFWVLTIVVLGLHQHNHLIVGVGLIVIGIVNGVYACFSFWFVKHWRIMTVYDADELYRNKYSFDRKSIKKEEEEIAVVRKIVAFIIAITAVIFPMVGIARLMGLC